MHGPGKGPSCSGLRMVPNISGYYSEERANMVLQVKKRQTHRRARTVVLTHWCTQTTYPESAHRAHINPVHRAESIW